MKAAVGTDAVFCAVRCERQKNLPLSAIFCGKRDHQNHPPKRRPRQSAERRDLAYAGELKIAREDDAVQMQLQISTDTSYAFAEA